MISGLTVPAYPSLERAPRIIPAGIATYCEIQKGLIGFLKLLEDKGNLTKRARFMESARLSHEESRDMGLKALSCRTYTPYR